MVYVTKGKTDLRDTLESSIKSSFTNKLEVRGEIIYTHGCEKFGVIEIKSVEEKKTRGRREMGIKL